MTTTVTRPRSAGDGEGDRPDPSLRLLFSPGATESRLFPLDPGVHAIGREVGDAGIGLPGDERVSRIHATLSVSADLTGVRLERCPGRNGTFVGRQRIPDSGSGPLQDGDVLRVGDSFFLYRARGAKVDAEVFELVGVSPAIARLRYQISRAAPDGATVLLRGETGTGKEVASLALHRLSGRRGPLSSVNCSAIPVELAESQLFGHVAGAFTGAKASPGLFRASHGGTLFLDEIGDVPLSLQPKLLRALEQGAVLSVGATTPVACDVRIIAATHQPLEREIAAGRFRADLYARLADLTLPLPPLRERREDVLLLLSHAGADLSTLPVDVIELLLLHAWPMNVREVFKIASHLRVFGPDQALRDRLARPPAGDEAPAPQPHASRPEAPPARKPGSLAQPSRGDLEALLTRHRGVILEVARELGCSRRQVGRWIDDLGIDRQRYRVSTSPGDDEG